MTSSSIAISAESYHIYGSKRTIVAIGLALILFISTLDSTIVAVALPTIGADFNDFRQTSWIVTAYLITYTAFLPILSKLTDIFGRRPVLIGSTLFFMLWSGACGGAKSMIQLIVFRALQGIGGSAIYSGVLLTISTMVPRTELPAYSSIIGAVFALSSVAGPLVGGAIVQHIHWGWIFFVNLPIGVVGTGLLFFALSDPKHEPITLETLKKRIDWIGGFLLVSFSVLLAYSLQVGGTSGFPWKSAKVLVPLILSFCLLPVFLFLETRHPEPILPLRLFSIRNVSLMFFFTFMIGAALYTMTVYLPQRMQIVDGVSPITAGVRMLPLLVLIGGVSAIAGALVTATKSYRPLIFTAAAIGAVGSGLLSTLKSPTNFPKMYGFQILVGFSIAVTITVSIVIVTFRVERRDLATATGMISFLRQLGALVSITACTAILNGKVGPALRENAQLASDPTLLDQITQSPTSVIPSLDSATQVFVRATYSKSYHWLFIVTVAWFGAATLSTLGLEHFFPDEFTSQPEQDSEMKIVALSSGDDIVEAGKTQI